MKIAPGAHCPLLIVYFQASIRIKTSLAAPSFPFLFFFFHQAQSKHASQERDFFIAKTTCDKERSSVCKKIT